MKNLKNILGARSLSKKELLEITGGKTTHCVLAPPLTPGCEESNPLTEEYCLNNPTAPGCRCYLDPTHPECLP